MIVAFVVLLLFVIGCDECFEPREQSVLVHVVDDEADAVAETGLRDWFRRPPKQDDDFVFESPISRERPIIDGIRDGIKNRPRPIVEYVRRVLVTILLCVMAFGIGYLAGRNTRA